ncbi:hypothetical protein QFC19_002955 [Naganishia cerealis]|uniref:Uncharacterized protein n=1 Tax=Naganishia cerealis TaxID=610337 RepID=A0ACC2W6V0_9TREE|nr:hypothetical protein QFC19_002955 [Naganishia cerealis]
MPAVKRKAGQSADGGSKKTAKPQEYQGETSSTHGMLARAMEDDMIDDVDSEDDDVEDDQVEEDEEGFTDLEEGAEDHEMSDGEEHGKGTKASLYKPPTAEEMEQLRRQEEERGGHFGFAMKASSFP